MNDAKGFTSYIHDLTFARNQISEIDANQNPNDLQLKKHMMTGMSHRYFREYMMDKMDDAAWTFARLVLGFQNMIQNDHIPCWMWSVIMIESVSLMD